MMHVKPVKVVQVDARGRISIKKFSDHSLYMIDVDDTGIITLTPMVALPLETSRRIDEFLGKPDSGVRVTRVQPKHEEIS